MSDLINRAMIFESAETGGSDMLAADLSIRLPAAFRITVALETAGVFSAVIKNGGTTNVYSFNSGNALGAGQLFTFTMGVHPSNTYNFRTSVTGTVTMQVDEVRTAVI